MRFEIIMHMPVRGGPVLPVRGEPPLTVAPHVPLVHRLIVEHSAESLRDFIDVLQNNDFIIVEEMFPGKHTKEYEPNGFVALNHRYVGKVKVWDRKNGS